jgi:hypothetical protein
MGTLGTIIWIIGVVWFIVGLFIPRKVAPFFKKWPRLKIFICATILISMGSYMQPTTDTNSTDKPQQKTEQVATEKASDAAKPDTKETKKESKNNPFEYKIGEAVHSGNFDFTVLNKTVSNVWIDDNGYTHSPSSGTYVIITLKYKNTSKSSAELKGDKLGLVLDGVTYGYQYQKVTNSDEYIDMINPGIEKTIKLYFDVPSDKANSKDFKFLIVKGMLESGPDEQFVILN